VVNRAKQARRYKNQKRTETCSETRREFRHRWIVESLCDFRYCAVVDAGSSKVSATFATSLSSLPDRRKGMRFAVNAEALADAIKALLLDSDTRKLFAKNARNSLDEKFPVYPKIQS
jgi:hypothetical protein